MKNKEVFSKKDELIMLAIRLWSAGAIAFLFIFGGTITGSSIDLIVYLTLIHYLVERFILEPVSRNGFKTRLNLSKQITYKNSKLSKVILNTLFRILIMLIIVVLVVLTYSLINIIINNLFNYETGTSKFAVEPFGYLIIFNGYYYIYYFTKYYVNQRRINKNEF